MTLAPKIFPITRRVETTFCDDIRQEANGKLLLIGVYTGTMLVAEFPITLVQLCIVIKLIAPRAHHFKSFSIKVFVGDDVVAETPMQDSTQIPEMNKLVDESKALVTNLYFMNLSPLVLHQPGLIRIRAFDEDGSEYAGCGLLVTMAEQLA